MCQQKYFFKRNFVVHYETVKYFLLRLFVRMTTIVFYCICCDFIAIICRCYCVYHDSRCSRIGKTSLNNNIISHLCVIIANEQKRRHRTCSKRIMYATMWCGVCVCVVWFEFRANFDHINYNINTLPTLIIVLFRLFRVSLLSSE